jgi:hypothetical protein
MSLAFTEFHVNVARYMRAKLGDPSRPDARSVGDTSVSEQPDKSAVAKHSFNTGHCIDFSGTIVLDRTSSYVDRLVKEAIVICLNNINFNRDVHVEP